MGWLRLCFFFTPSQGGSWPVSPWEDPMSPACLLVPVTRIRDASPLFSCSVLCQEECNVTAAGLLFSEVLCSHTCGEDQVAFHLLKWQALTWTPKSQVCLLLCAVQCTAPMSYWRTSAACFALIAGCSSGLPLPPSSLSDAYGTLLSLALHFMRYHHTMFFF